MICLAHSSCVWCIQNTPKCVDATFFFLLSYLHCSRFNVAEKYAAILLRGCERRSLDFWPLYFFSFPFFGLSKIKRDLSCEERGRVKSPCLLYCLERVLLFFQWAMICAHRQGTFLSYYLWRGDDCQTKRVVVLNFSFYTENMIPKNGAKRLGNLIFSGLSLSFFFFISNRLSPRWMQFCALRTAENFISFLSLSRKFSLSADCAG